MLRCYILIRNLFSLLLLLLTALKKPSIWVAHTHLTLSLWIKVKQVKCDQNLVARTNKKLVPISDQNSVTHANQLKLHEIVTSYGRNDRIKNPDDEIKKTKRSPITSLWGY